MNSRFSSQEGVWGLYDEKAKIAIPLKSLHASVSIINSVSRVKYTQNYVNDSEKFIETNFFFPISSDACFDSFEAKFADTTIKGVIKKKQQAQEEYKEAIAQGRTAAYSEINQETGDIMKIMIGNIPPKTTVAITYSYIQKLEVAANKFLCFRLFSTITPRYNGNLQDALKADIALLSSYPTISSQDPEAYPWTIETEIQSASPITFVKSPSHDITPTYGNENHTCKVIFKSNEPQYPNKDFILLYTNGKKQDKIDSRLTPFEEDYCAMVNLRADFQAVSDVKIYENLVNAKEIENEYSMDEVRGEFIFLIDRSGSMDGERIEMARDSLVLFLRSLPQDSLFNVVSFGSSYEFLYNDSSQKYSSESLEQSVNKVQKFQADMGGTEIYNVLNRIFTDPIKTGYPRSIFLLTDGAVTNTFQVLNLIKSNSHKSKVFTIGIGDGCSQELITRGAVCGRGKHEFVANNNEVYEKVISLLKASLSPCYSEISLESDNFDAVVKAVTPNPTTIPLLLDGQNVTFFLFLRSEAFVNNKMVLKLSINDSRSQQRRSVDIVLDTNEAMHDELIPKLAVHDMIRRLEIDRENLMWMSKEEEDIQEALLDLSLKYGVLCKETAFFCETEKSNVKTIQDAQKIKIVIPTTHSRDSSKPIIRLKSWGYGTKPCRDGDKHKREHRDKEKAGEDLISDKRDNGQFFADFLIDRKEVCDSYADIGSLLREDHLCYKRESTILNDDYLDTLDALLSGDAGQVNSSSSYLRIVKKQKFEGFWDPQDLSISQNICKYATLPEVPDEIKKIDASLAQTIWVTLLVLLWLETACQNDRKAWLLIYQKGVNWLKKVGVNYNETKSLGAHEVNGLKTKD